MIQHRQRWLPTNNQANGTWLVPKSTKTNKVGNGSCQQPQYERELVKTRYFPMILGGGKGEGGGRERNRWIPYLVHRKERWVKSINTRVKNIIFLHHGSPKPRWCVEKDSLLFSLDCPFFFLFISFLPSLPRPSSLLVLLSLLKVSNDYITAKISLASYP